jgi:peptidoglycan/LPS O-acetylase OafA/YrhL
MKESTARFGPLDGVRGIAVLIVFLSHTSGRGMYVHPQLNFTGIGHVGVYLFFCLSAFLLAGKLFDQGISRITVYQFYIRRFFRIVPLYYSVLLFVFVMQYFFGHYNESFLHIKNDVPGFVQHLIFYRGDGVFWSVVVEEQFYLLVPLWIYLILRFRNAAVLIFGLIAAFNFTLYLCKYLHWPFNTEAIRYFTTNDRSSGNYVDIFIVTIIMMYFENRYRSFLENNKRMFAVIANVLFLTLMVFTVVLVSESFLGFRYVWYEFRYISMLYAVVFSVFIISVRLGNPVNRLLSFAVLRYVGIFGFSIYLLHMFVFEMVVGLPVIHYLKFILAGAGIFALSAATYYGIEKPFIRLSYRLSDRIGSNLKMKA